jgi:hypothetical protein
MRSTARLSSGGMSLGIVGVLVCGLSAFSIFANAQSGSQGQNAIYDGNNNIVGSSAFIDASMFATSPPRPRDFCKVLNWVLTHGYPATGAVVDARGLNSANTSMTCSISPWGSGSSSVTLPSTILLPATGGTTPTPIVISTTWVLPSNTHLIGEGDGIPSSGFTPGTTIQAGTGFSGSMIQFGTAPPPSSPLVCPLVGSVYTCTGISVENLTLDGQGQSINGISNTYSQDGSYVNHVSLYQIRDVGLVIQGGAQGNASNSGPYSNIIFDLGGNSGTSQTVCASINGTTGTQGIHGLTCISETNDATAAILLDSSNNSIEDESLASTKAKEL